MKSLSYKKSSQRNLIGLYRGMVIFIVIVLILFFFILVRYPQIIFTDYRMAFSTDGKHFYFNGNLIKEAESEPYPIYPKDAYYITYYFTDGKHVFYREKCLDVPYNDSLATLSFYSKNKLNVLYNRMGGKVFINGKPFNPDRPPYKLFYTSVHSNHLFFTNDNGIYYYDKEKEKAYKAYKNIFKGKEITDLGKGSFSVGGEIFYFHKDKKKRKHSLKWYSTTLYKKISPTDKEVIFSVKTNTHSWLGISVIIGLLALIIFFYLFLPWFFKKLQINTDPFILEYERNSLRINNFFGKRYFFSEIKEAIFVITQQRKYNSSHYASIKFLLINGKTSKSYRFYFRQLDTLKELSEKVKELQHQLEEVHIRSKFVHLDK